MWGSALAALGLTCGLTFVMTFGLIVSSGSAQATTAHSRPTAAAPAGSVNATKSAAKAAAAKGSAAAKTPAPSSKARRSAVKAAVAVGGAGAVVAAAKAMPARPSMGQLYGLHQTPDPLDLRSSVALVLDRHTNEVLFSKNAQAVLPIASITKLMTSMIVFERQQDLDEVLTITQDDVDTEKGSGSRLAVGTRLTRREMLHLALMSSENRAAHALGRHYPGGLDAFVVDMNQRAQELGMHDTRFVEPTGLSSRNQSSAHDLAVLVKASHSHEMLRQFSVSQEAQVSVGKRLVQFRNTNGLVRAGNWDIALQKTGYISEAGRCVVMMASMAGRELIMVLMDSAGSQSRIIDAERLRKWVTEHARQGIPETEKSSVRFPSAG